jgi:hypothetical protein
LCFDALARIFVPSSAMPEPEHAGLLRQPQRLHKQRRERGQVRPAKRADHVVIPGGIGRHEGQILLAPSLDLPQTAHARAVRVPQQHGHRPRIIRRLPPIFAVRVQDRLRVQPRQHTSGRNTAR